METVTYLKVLAGYEEHAHQHGVRLPAALRPCAELTGLVVVVWTQTNRLNMSSTVIWY